METEVNIKDLFVGGMFKVGGRTVILTEADIERLKQFADKKGEFLPAVYNRFLLPERQGIVTRFVRRREHIAGYGIEGPGALSSVSYTAHELQQAWKAATGTYPGLSQIGRYQDKVAREKVGRNMGIGDKKYVRTINKIRIINEGLKGVAGYYGKEEVVRYKKLAKVEAWCKQCVDYIKPETREKRQYYGMEEAETLKEAMGELLYIERCKMGVDHIQAARAVGVDVDVIMDIDNGRKYKEEDLVKYCKFLKVDPEKMRIKADKWWELKKI
jgi:hypothetical protein